MKKDLDLIVFNSNPFSKIINFFRNILKKKKLKAKAENIEIKHQNKIYLVEYDTDPLNTEYGDTYDGDIIIRNSPYTKEIINPIKYNNNSYSKDEKNEILRKYMELLNNNISSEELNLDEIIIIDKLMKEELKIRNNK